MNIMSFYRVLCSRLRHDGARHLAGATVELSGDAAAPLLAVSAIEPIANPKTQESECSKPEAPTESPAVVVETAPVPEAPEVSPTDTPEQQPDASQAPSSTAGVTPVEPAAPKVSRTKKAD